MQFLFYNTKEEFKADQLFEENEIIKIRQNSFEQILEKLETYNLSDTQDDVKGIAFEQFLGTTFRGELGQYFTPRTIVVGKSLLSLYDVGSMSGLTEVLFMERCLRLLKKGGRMGMVLPEGVLNTSNLQKIREYFEGKAKIILICSIPQDVFIAAGATVKPSLVFFKRFTEEEELQYLGAKTRAEKEIRQKYIGQIKALQEKIVEEKSKKLKVKALIAAAEKELRDLEKAIIEEAKPLTKEYFHYEIPIAMVEDAGITSTGAVSAGNQLPTLQDEYKEYRIAKKLWNEANSVVY